MQCLFHEAHGEAVPVYQSKSLYNESKTRNYNINRLVRVAQDLSELLPWASSALDAACRLAANTSRNIDRTASVAISLFIWFSFPPLRWILYYGRKAGDPPFDVSVRPHAAHAEFI
jgi:hypothetical protein